MDYDKLMRDACALGDLNAVIDRDTQTDGISITKSHYVRTAILCGHNDIINYILEKANGDENILHVGCFLDAGDEIVKTLLKYNCIFWIYNLDLKSPNYMERLRELKI